MDSTGRVTEAKGREKRGPLGQRYLDMGKLPSMAPLTLSLGLAESGILKARGQKPGDLKNVCDQDHMEPSSPDRFR